MGSAGVKRIVSVSGGKDSTAMYLWAMESFGNDFLAVFADTGHEHPVTLNYVRNLPAMAKGPAVHWTKADLTEPLKRKELARSDSPFFDMLMVKGMMPSGNKQFCTTVLKLEPIRAWIETVRGDDDVFIYLGIRAQESAKRAKLPPKEFSEFYDAEVIRPILNWKIEEVFEIHKKHGIEPNPLYANGMSRVGCFPCINANKMDLRTLPDWAWDKIRKWEQSLGVPWFKPGLVPGTQGCPTIDQVREWCHTERGAKFLDVNSFVKETNDVPSCMSTWGACE